MAGRQQGLCKAERLSSRKEITRLFEEGSSFYSYPFNAIWAESRGNGKYPVQFAVSVTKRSFKKAVDRNRIKRLIRESWRRNKYQLYNILEQHNLKLIVMLIYSGKNIPGQELMDRKINELILNFSLNLPIPGGKNGPG